MPWLVVVALLNRKVEGGSAGDSDQHTTFGMHVNIKILSAIGCSVE